MIDLHIIVNNKIATYQKRDGDIVCGNKYDEEKQSGYQIKFTFDDEWNAYENKTARFIFGGHFHDVEFTGDTCPVPVLKGVTFCKVGVYAGDLCTTTSATIGCKTSILCKSATPSVENDKYYANEARKYAEEAKEYAEKAGNGTAGGSPGENGATFIPSVSNDGILSWTNDKGLENPAPVSIKGADGKDGTNGVDGKDGADGKTPYIQNGYWYIDGVNTNVKAQGENGKDGVDGKDYVLTPADKTEIADEVATKIPFVKSPEAPTFVNSVEEFADTTKTYVLCDKNSPDDGYIFAYMPKTVTTEGGKVPNFKNLMDKEGAYVRATDRFSFSGKQFQKCDTDGAIVVPVENLTECTIRVIGAGYKNQKYRSSVYFGETNTMFDIAPDGSGTQFDVDPSVDTSLKLAQVPISGYKYMVFHVAPPIDEDNLIVTVNEPITYTTTEGGTVTTYQWTNTGHHITPADYENRIIANEQNILDLKDKDEYFEERLNSISLNSNGTTVFSTPAYAPTPQLPADGSEGSDFNSKTLSTQIAYDYMDVLCNKYTAYITKQTMGKDASGAFDHNRYILAKAYWRAWQKENYPKMYAWKNGSTVIYSVSVSPRVGDNMYSTPYIGTIYKTVSSVNCTAGALSTRTVNGLVFTRYTDGDIKPTVIYTKVPRYPKVIEDWKIYNSSFGSLGTVAEYGDNFITDSNGVKYFRYPFEDRKADKSKLLSIFILSNEHGFHGDALIPSMVVMRMAKDLCKNTENPFLKWLKENCMITMIPVGNPWGYGRYLDNNSSGYYNSNGVNINRNYDTPGWATSDTNYGDVETFGAYAGSEVETQHIMNTMQLCKPSVGISMHGLEFPLQYKDLPDNGYFIYQGCGFDVSRMANIAETLYSVYGLGASGETDQAQHYNNCGKSPAYIQYVGAVGGLTETNCWEAGTNNEYTAIAMEQAYTQMLLFLQTWCEEALEK